MSDPSSIFTRLMQVVESRKHARAENSYTQTLFDGGVDATGAKLCEEAGELVEAARLAGGEGRGAVVHEAADLVYHLFVLLADRGVALADVEGELERRFGTSGLTEKARRTGR